MKNRSFYPALALAMVILWSACAREQLADKEAMKSNTAALEDELLIEDYMEVLFETVEFDDWWLNGFKSERDNNGCVQITADPAERGVFPKTITLDYGSGCESERGHLRKGKIEIELSASPRSEAWTKKITFTRFSIDDKVIQGGKSISYLAEGRRGLPTWTSQSRISIKVDEEITIQQTATRTRMQTAGADTPQRPGDDAFVITGSSTGTNRDGKGYKSTITTPLELSKDCRWIKKGVWLYQVRGESDATLDYGDGTCDDLAIYTRDGESKEIRIGR